MKEKLIYDAPEVEVMEIRCNMDLLVASAESLSQQNGIWDEDSES